MSASKLALGFAVMLALSAQASLSDQWSSYVAAHCYPMESTHYDHRFAIHVSAANITDGQLMFPEDRNTGLYWLSDIADSPLTCAIAGRPFTFEVTGYVPERVNGMCGINEISGFRLASEGVTLWEREPNKTKCDPIPFHGTIDVDGDAVFVCERGQTCQTIEIR